MSTTPGEMQYPGFPEPPVATPPKKTNRGKVVAIVAMVVALVAAVAVGRASATSSAGQPIAAPATVTSTAPPRTVATTTTATVTADPTTITAPPVSVTTTVTVTEAAAGPSATIKDGINLVGVDVQPGTYRSDNADCYWARLSGTSGSLNDIISNSNGATVVTIDPADRAFESRRCAPWTQVG